MIEAADDDVIDDGESSITSSSNADAIPSQVTLGAMLCKSRVEVPKMQRQTLVVTQVSQVKALKTKCPETVRTPPRVRFPEVCPVVQTVNIKSMTPPRVRFPKGCPVVQTASKSRELAQKVQSKDSKNSKYWPDDLIGSIAKTINRQYKQPSQTEFKFELSK